MVLSPFDKDILNQLVDHCVNNIDGLFSLARIPEIKSMLKDKDGIDFVLGIAITEIQAGFIAGFKMRNERGLNKEESAELFNFFGTRIYEIKEAIFKYG